MGSYFKCYSRGKFIIKTLIKKKGGSPYPNITEFIGKMALLKKELGNFMVDTEIYYDGNHIKLKQTKILGEDLFDHLHKYKDRKPKRFINFLQKLNKFYKKTKMLPDFLNNNNILVTKNNEIKIIDVWPLFFNGRVKTGDISKKSYEENLERFNFLKNI